MQSELDTHLRKINERLDNLGYLELIEEELSEHRRILQVQMKDLALIRQATVFVAVLYALALLYVVVVRLVSLSSA